jgi:hypothetical protein
MKEELIKYVMQKADGYYSDDFPINLIEDWINDFFKSISQEDGSILVRQKLISVKDRLPKKDIPVICYCYKKYVGILEYWYDDEEGKPIFMHNALAPPVTGVSHWMSLPKPPEDL